MNLGTIRAKFIELSGRDDLVNADDTDNGANYFITAGQRFLEKKFGHAEASVELSSDSDTNWWTLETPDTLITASLYQLELSYRNSEGARDWMNGVDLNLHVLELEQVDDEVTGVDQMEG